MIKHFCDKCGKEVDSDLSRWSIDITAPTITIWGEENPFYGREICLCSSCMKIFSNWLREGPAVKEADS